jgi:hypothetical protein
MAAAGRLLYSGLALCLALCGCNSAPSFPAAAPSTGKRPTPAEQNFRPSDIAKSDIDIVAEVHLRESLASTRLLMEKLYRRNPREWHKGGSGSMESAVEHAFDPSSHFVSRSCTPPAAPMQSCSRYSLNIRATACSPSALGWAA